mmetsp:Transcript_4477/g.11061  ORF Transcript_4477/g.11061 Transcript_4477/m.11061 type:complete len:312 (+) Transcript_4477:852-1787(+)
MRLPVDLEAVHGQEDYKGDDEQRAYGYADGIRDGLQKEAFLGLVLAAIDTKAQVGVHCTRPALGLGNDQNDGCGHDNEGSFHAHHPKGPPEVGLEQRDGAVHEDAGPRPSDDGAKPNDHVRLHAAEPMVPRADFKPAFARPVVDLRVEGGQKADLHKEEAHAQHSGHAGGELALARQGQPGHQIEHHQGDGQHQHDEREPGKYGSLRMRPNGEGVGAQRQAGVLLLGVAKRPRAVIQWHQWGLRRVAVARDKDGLPPGRDGCSPGRVQRLPEVCLHLVAVHGFKAGQAIALLVDRQAYGLAGEAGEVKLGG